MAGEPERTVTVRTIQQAIELADWWAARAAFWQRRAELHAAENERLRIFLKAADTINEGEK